VAQIRSVGRDREDRSQRKQNGGPLCTGSGMSSVLNPVSQKGGASDFEVYVLIGYVVEQRIKPGTWKRVSKAYAFPGLAKEFAELWKKDRPESELRVSEVRRKRKST
jgi:hypothetical protein